MRTRNSLLNIISNCACYLILMISGLILKKLFVDSLGMQCVGIDARFTDYVSILSIIELNLGISLIYKLYDPIANRDIERLSIILSFLKKSYIIIAICIVILGIPFSFFAVHSIKEDYNKLWLLRMFLLYLADSICSYFYYHKRVMIIANQHSRVIGIIRSCCIAVLTVVQIFILKIFKSFELYIIAKIFSRIAENIFISIKFNKKYNVINTNRKLSFSKEKKNEILQSIKAMLFHKVGAAGLNQISSVIFGLVSLSLLENGIYSNYMLIVIALWGISSEFFRGILASFGNLLNTESKEKVEENFNVIFLINFFIYSFFCSSFLCLVDPFMKIWISESGACFGLYTTVLIVINLYIYGMRQSIGMAKESAGIFVQDRYFPVLETIFNFSVSYFLTKKIGISGVIIGSTVSSFITFFTYPFFVYKILFNKNPIKYYKKYFLYMIIAVIEAVICYFSTKMFLFGSIFQQIAINSIICLIIPNIMNIMIFYRTREFSRVSSSALSIYLKIRKG